MATVIGTEGDDVLSDRDGQSDLVLGLGGNDTITGGTAGSRSTRNPDTLDGGDGDDMISVSSIGGGHLLIGGNGNDKLIISTPGGDTLQGGNGNDVLISVSITGQFLDGGDGDDIFNTSNVPDSRNNVYNENTIDGGNGFDVINSSNISFSSTTTPVILNIDDLLPSDLLSLGFGERIKNIESIASIKTGSGDDVISLSRDFDPDITRRIINVGGGNNLVTNSGNAKTQISGGGQQDTLIGGNNDDTLYGGGGDDVLTGGAGNDKVYGDEGDDYGLGGEGDDSLLDGLGNDNLEGNTGNDTILGENGDDGLAGQEGDDSLVGGKGNDRLYGWLGNDTLSGDEGNDLLFGDGGDDTLRGGQGNDTLTGDYVDQAAGADTFAFDKLSGAITFADLGVDIITDFQSSSDKILLDKAIFTALPGVLDATTFQVVDTIAQAETSAGLIVYSQGQLIYNANGVEAGYGEGGQFAILEALPAATLTADHFVVT
jgi:Ca2+-binding RTX toxin-like protein